MRAYLALLIPREPNRVEVLHHLLGRVVLLDLAVKVEAHHVARVDLARQLEELEEALLLGLLHALLAESDDEVDVHVVVVLFVVLFAPESADTSFLNTLGDAKDQP